MAKTRRTRKNPVPRPRFTGWLSTDAEEVERHRLRGAEEAFRMEALSREHEFFNVYRIRSHEGQDYRIEIRSLVDPINSCDCPDHRINGPGTCKHVEAVLQRLAQGRKRAFRRAGAAGSPWLEVYLDRRDQRVRLAVPAHSGRPTKARELLTPFFDDGILVGEPLDTLPALLRAVRAAPARVRRRIRLSEELHVWLDHLDREAQRRRARRHFEAEVEAGRASLDMLKHPLYPYQQEGMLHLAFSGRALLADDMGLGKTVQAVAACELLRAAAWTFAGSWWCLRHPSRASGRNRSPSSPACPRALSRGRAQSACASTGKKPSSIVPTMSRSVPTWPR